MIDSHQHFWRITRPDCEWPTPALGKIYRDYLPSDLKPWLENSGVEASVLVQSQPCESDTVFLLSLADESPQVKAVVGWVELQATDIDERLDRLAASSKFRGVRPMLQAIEQSDWVLRPELAKGLQALCDRGLTFDALIEPRHLPVIAKLANRYPSLKIVIDHGAKPRIDLGEIAFWQSEISTFVDKPNVYCKLSGLVTEALPEQLQRPAVFSPYVRQLLAVFGVERLMWGSDWPVVELVSDYSTWLSLAKKTLREQVAQLYPNEKLAAAEQAVFSSNARRFYSIV